MFKNKSLIITIIATIIIIEIAAAPKLCIDSAINGALLFFYKVFPSLFPFLVVSNLILAYDGVFIYSRLFGRFLCRPLGLPEECGFVIIVSMLCGYPLGAKYSCDLYERGIIKRSTFLRLLNIASNPSPIFIIGTVGISMLHNNISGYLLVFSCYASCAVLGIILPFKEYKKSPCKRNHLFSPVNFGEAIKNSVDNGLSTSISIGGFVIIFSVINSYINNLLLSSGIAKNMIIGIIEMTNGCSLISKTNCELILKLSLISFILAFSGMSIIAQVYSFAAKYKVPILKYIGLKLFQGVISGLITFVLGSFFMAKSSVFTANIVYKSSNSMIQLFALTLLILPFVFYNIKGLLKFP
ncbi:MAG: sporulation integral membrane protein YlbJ [Solirubrobacterales bacterium]